VSAPRVYIETTLFNYYFDDEHGLGHAASVALFEECAAGKFEGYTSDYVLNELRKTQSEKGEKMLALAQRYALTVLALSEEAEQLADMYIEQGVIPPRHRTDAIHIAVAAVHSLDVIASMNFRHIVKLKTKTETGNINKAHGYRAVEICTPMEVSEYESI
jgi:predicted nucleic acid-binding protein